MSNIQAIVCTAPLVLNSFNQCVMPKTTLPPRKLMGDVRDVTFSNDIVTEEGVVYSNYDWVDFAEGNFVYDNVFYNVLDDTSGLKYKVTYDDNYPFTLGQNKPAECSTLQKYTLGANNQVNILGSISKCNFSSLDSCVTCADGTDNCKGFVSCNSNFNISPPIYKCHTVTSLKTSLNDKKCDLSLACPSFDYDNRACYQSPTQSTTTTLPPKTLAKTTTTAPKTIRK